MVVRCRIRERAAWEPPRRAAGPGEAAACAREGSKYGFSARLRGTPPVLADEGAGRLPKAGGRPVAPMSHSPGTPASETFQGRAPPRVSTMPSWPLAVRLVRE